MHTFSALPTLCLASSSRYRQALLQRLRIPFITAIPNIDESPLIDEPPEATAQRLALAKAQAVHQQNSDTNMLIIGSDQVACVDSQLLGKPGNHAQALSQLQAMRGRTVIFYTALCLLDCRNQQTYQALIPTQVKMRSLTDEQLNTYLQIEKPYDCAGSAKSEELGIALIEKIQSDDPTALVGLPLIALTDLLNQAGCPPLQFLSVENPPQE
jgi:septum formation protein